MNAQTRLNFDETDDDGNSSYRVQRVSEEITVVLLGNESFVSSATTDVENWTGTVDP